MSLEGRLRETSDTLLMALDELSTLEREKRDMAPGDPALPQISGRIEEIAEQVFGASAAQRALTEQASAEIRAGTRAADGPSIAETPRPAADILREWRRAEQLAAAAAPGSPEEAEFTARCSELRAEYLRVFDKASGQRS